MFGCAIAVVFEGELSLLQLGVGRHAMLAIALRQFEHTVVEGVETGKCDKLELIAHFCEFVLEVRNRFGIKLLAPVKGW